MKRCCQEVTFLFNNNLAIPFTIQIKLRLYSGVTKLYSNFNLGGLEYTYHVLSSNKIELRNT